MKGLDQVGAGSWRWRRMVDGVKHQVVFKAETEAKALQIAQGLEKRPGLLSGRKWEELVERYIMESLASGRLATGRSRKNALLGAGRAMGLSESTDATPARVQIWYREVLAATKGRTANQYLGYLAVFAKWLMERRLLYLDPTADIERVLVQSNARDRFLPADEVATLLELARVEEDPELELMLLLGFECGMRHGEISAAAAEWVDLPRGLITVPAVDEDEAGEGFRRKGRVGKRRPVTVPMVGRLRAWFEEHGVPAPFLLRPDIEWTQNQYRYEFRRKLVSFFERHGHEGLTIHDMRRSFGSNRVSAGVSLEKVAHWLGIHPGTAWRHYARFIPADDEIERGAAGAAAGAGADEAAAAEGVAGRLRQLKELVAEGLLTEAEAAARRAEIVREI